jgi:hypothetical protein
MNAPRPLRILPAAALVWAALVLPPQPAEGLGIPLTRNEGHWTPTRLDRIAILGMRLTIVPAMDEAQERVVWTVDETLEVFNSAAETQVLSIGIPNGWSAEADVLSDGPQDFWGEAWVNGVRQATEVVNVVPNPAHPGIAYRQARHFEVRLEPGQAAHLRMRFGLPAAPSSLGERTLRYPFRLRPLWGGAISSGVVLIRWTDQMYGFRSNLAAYSHYGDRVEWFVRDFEPASDLEIEFLPRQAVFTMVARAIRCPMPWEVLDRVADGDQLALQEMLAPYTTDQLEMCAALPPTLRGSVVDAESSGFDELDLAQFSPANSGLSGPIFIEDPDYDASRLGESESLYVRFLRQELANRR